MDALKTLSPLKTSEETMSQRYWWHKFMEDLGHCFTQSNLPPTEKLFKVLRENWQFLNTPRKELAAHQVKALKEKLSYYSSEYTKAEFKVMNDPTAPAPSEATMAAIKKMTAEIIVIDKAAKISANYTEFLSQYIQLQQITLAALRNKIPADALVAIEHLMDEKRGVSNIIDNVEIADPDDFDEPEMIGSELDDIGAENGLDLGATNASGKLPKLPRIEQRPWADFNRLGEVLSILSARYDRATDGDNFEHLQKFSDHVNNKMD
jgi:hypothetical protein